MRKKLFTFLLALAASVGMSWAAPAVAVNGKLPGAFSVSGTKVVYFSQGNLQYTKSTGKWKIMDHQYDMVETSGQNVGTDYASQDVITLFGWGTSGWDNTAADATSVHYQPYSTCKTIHNSNANINNYQYGPSNANVVGSSKAASAESWSKSDSYKNYDWGVFNSGDLGSGWRVLTTQEWGYLLGSTSPARTNAANLRTLATVNSVPGLIIMPDGWTASGVSLTVTTSKYTTNNINLTNWSTLEEQGCVFLPAAGFREGTSVMDNVGTRGFYWSSSAYSANYAYILRFYTNSMGPQEINGRYDGCSVRLVSETAPTPEPSETTVTWDLSDMASMGTQGGYFKAKGITLMAYGVDNGMSGDGSYGGAFFGGPFVFTTSLGKFTKIEVTNSYLYDQPAFSGDDWTLDGTNAVWEGTPAALVSLVSNFGGITQIKFTIAPNTSTPANSCGDGLTWAVNDGVLTISYDGVGTGSMDNYDDPLSMPWRNETFTSVVLPEGLISIGQNAFAFINTFSQITLPSTLQYILMNAFSGCGLTSVTIPENVKGISASAFISSQSLATVTFEPTTPPRVGGNAFEYCHNDLIINYPCESKAQYYNDMQADIAYYHDKMYNCPAPTPSGDKLSGVFSVSADKAVNFSKGNLQYDSDNQIWQFAANQWDYIGNAAGNNAITSDGIADNNGIVDMFCWVGASSSLEGIKQYGIIKSWSGYGSVAGEALKSDWGNTMGGDWRTLSKDEWIYLLTERTNAANLRTLGTVNGKAGLILMPDGWTASGVSLTVTTANYTTNDINITNWATLEGQGCAFLPAAGCCMSGLFDGVGGDGSYWSSTSRASGSTHAHRLHFRATDVDPTDFVERFTGMSVRLVSETAPAPTPANPVIKLNANFGGTYDWADTEAFTDNGDGTATLSNIALEFGYYYNFRVKVDGVSISDNHEFTRQNPSYVISSGSGDVYYFQADVTGNYSFTWEYATNTLTIGYPASTPTVDQAVQNVIDLINAIPNPVVYNQECFSAINAVYDAYVALSEEQRDQVTNYDDYLAAEERYYMLGSVNGVIEAINEIGDVEFTSACKHRIDYARSEYCSLTLEAKGYVTNYNTLLAAEAAYAALIPVSSTVVWDEAILETIDVDEWNVTTYTNGSISLKAVDGRAYYVDDEQHFLFDGSNSEKSFVFSCTSANLLRIEIEVSEKHEHNELSCAWQETATGYRWVGEATSVDLASTIFKVTGIRFSLGEAFPEPTPTPAQDGDKLPGAFSVDGGKVVYFSKGNLQYLGNIDRWHFAENQWTIIGNAQASDNRDLFSWGTGANPDSEDYSTYTEWGNNIEGNWRTLTVDEWTYLFNTRTGASSKYGTATVAGVVGLILLPDVYDGTAINTERTAWNNNVISSSEWAAYEAKGAVFLPAAGLSDAFGVYGVGEQGFYWSSTMDELSHYAISVFYGFDGFEGYWFNQVDAKFQPQEGHSVRLVSETAPTPTPVTSYVVEFALGDAEGTAPTTVDVTVGNELTMPVNKTMYKAGYTLTGWSDGVNTYPIGESFTPANDVVLTPVFTANQADLLNASSDVTVKWYFGGDNGAPVMHLEGSAGLLVARATIGDKTVDVKLAIDATSGKFVPEPTTEWAQVNVGTIFTYPYKAGMTVNVDNYKSNVTYYIADAEGKVTCCENDHYSFIEVTYPASTPAPQPTTEEVITNVDPENPGTYYYSTFFHSTQNYKLTNDGTQAFIADLSGSDLVLTKIAEGAQVIPANTAVILRKTGSADPVVLTPTEENGVSVNPDDNSLKGVDAVTTLESLSINPDNCYVLSGTAQYGVGFYKINATSLKAHKAYVLYNGTAAPARMRFIFNNGQVATDIERVQSDEGVQKRIENGQLIIIRDGVYYNAQGQTVK